MAKTSWIFLIIVFVSLISGLVSPVKAQLIEDFWVAEIEDYLIQVDYYTTAEIVVVILYSLVGHGIMDEGVEINDVVQLGVYIFNELPLETFDGSQVGIGKKGKDNGVLILVAIEERLWRVEIGYGLEGYITDIESHNIAAQYLSPKLASGNLGEGLYDMVVALSEKIPDSSEQLPIRGTYLYESVETPESEGIPDWVIILLILAMILISGGALGGGFLFRRRSGSKRTEGGRSGGGGSKGKW